MNEKLKILDIEVFMYTFFIVASLIDIEANMQAKYNVQQGKELNEDLRKQYLLASYLILTVFIVFMKRNYYNLENLSIHEKEYMFAEIRLYGSILIVIGQILIIYYLYNTTIFK